VELAAAEELAAAPEVFAFLASASPPAVELAAEPESPDVFAFFVPGNDL
jgi:hypothetical protein